jgi:ethanolamine utilization protein EutN
LVTSADARNDPNSPIANELLITDYQSLITMFLARVEGSVVATKKDPSMSGRKLLLVRPQLVDDKDPTKFRPGANTIVAVDSVGAGIGELVMFCQGSSARLAPNLKDAPVDAVIIGIVDTVDVMGKQIYSAKH